MDKYTTGLEFKKHDHEFIVIREDLKRIQEISVKAKKEIGAVKNYFLEVQALFLINSSYSQDSKKIEEMLDKIEEGLNRKEYLESIKRGVTPSSEKQIREYERKLSKMIDRILRNMSEGFVEHQLRPRPIKQQRNILERSDLTPEERAKYYALKQIGIEVKDE